MVIVNLFMRHKKMNQFGIKHDCFKPVSRAVQGSSAFLRNLCNRAERIEKKCFAPYI
jgi:hypothetical protein